MGIIGCTCNGNSGKKKIPSKYMTERLKKRDKKESKNERERAIISKNWESNICDGKNLNHNM